MPLLLFAGAVALLPLAALVVTLAVIALFWLAWAALWFLEQRW